MAIELTGQLIDKLPVSSGISKSGNNWAKQEFLIETQESYPRKICITAFGEEKMRDLNNVQVGDKVTVSVDIESREWSGRWYTEVRMWRIVNSFHTQNSTSQNEGAAAHPTPPAMPASAPLPTTPPPVFDLNSGGEDDLPF